MEKYEINTILRKSAFIAQVGHESGGLRFTKENLNYSAEGLLDVFPKYFKTLTLAKMYAHNPVKIANRVYANRMGNGNEVSGDGWKHKGYGLIQLTGRLNQAEFAADFEMLLDEAVLYLQTDLGATMSAGWFWNKHHLNDFADNSDIRGMTKIINGGTIGLPERLNLFIQVQTILRG